HRRVQHQCHAQRKMHAPTHAALPDHGDRQVAGLRARKVLQGDLRDALDRRDGAADVPVDPEVVCLVHLPPRLGRGIEGSTRDDRVDQPPGLRVLDEDADALAQRIDRRRVRIGELHAATELERAARGVAALAELQRRPDERGGFGVVARSARVADPVGVAGGLVRVWGARRVRRAVVADPVAALGEIALAARQPADGGALRVRRAGGVGARAPLGEVAVAGSRAALHRGRLEGVLGASGARPGAALRDVAVAGGGPALDAARLEAIGRAEGARPGAALGDVAVAGRRSAFGARREQDVGRARVVDAVTGLCDGAVARGGAADDVRAVLIHGVDAGSRAVTDVLRAGIRVVRARARCSLRRTDTLGVLAGVEAGAGIQVVAGGAVGECRSGAPAPAAHAVLGAVVRVAARGLVRERRAGADAALAAVVRRAVVGVVARFGGRTAHDGARREGVGGAVAADAVTLLGDVAPAGRGAARGGALQVRGTDGARPRAGLGDVARSGRGPALDGGRLEGVVGARDVRAGAGLRDVALAGRRTALEGRRPERVSGTRGAVGGAALGDVAVAGGGAAFHGGGLERIDRAGGAAAGAALGEVAVARGGAALDGRELERIGRAGGAVAAAALGDVAVAGGGATFHG